MDNIVEHKFSELLRKHFLEELVKSEVKMTKELADTFLPVLLSCIDKSLIHSFKDLEKDFIKPAE